MIHRTIRRLFKINNDRTTILFIKAKTFKYKNVQCIMTSFKSFVFIRFSSMGNRIILPIPYGVIGNSSLLVTVIKVYM